MKVLHVIPSYEPAWAFGGTVTATVNLCRAFARQGVDITVYTTDADGKGGHLDVPLNEPIDLEGVKVLYFRCHFGIKRAFYSRGLAQKLKETVSEFDIIDVSAIWQWIQVDVSNICKQFSIPYVVTPHGSFSSWVHGQKSTKKYLYWRLFGKKTIERAKVLRFTTEAERLDSFEAFSIFSSVPSFVVPNGITLDETDYELDQDRQENKNNKLNLLYVGRIHRIKNLHLIIKAVRKIGENYFSLTLVGPRADNDYINSLCRQADSAGLELVLYDTVPKGDVWKFYKVSDLFILPSSHENFSMVVVEAMACGLPVLISRNVGIWKEVEADGAGFIVDQNAEEIGKVLKYISENRTVLKKMSGNAERSARERYDINKVANLMIKAYEDVLTGKRSPELQWS